MSHSKILVGLSNYSDLYGHNVVTQAFLHLAQIDDRAKLYHAEAKGTIIALSGLYRLSKFFKDSQLSLLNDEKDIPLNNRIYFGLPDRKHGIGTEFSEHAYHVEAINYYEGWIETIRAMRDEEPTELEMALCLVVHELKTLIKAQLEESRRLESMASAVSVTGTGDSYGTHRNNPVRPISENLNDELAIREDLMRKHGLNPDDPLAGAFEDALEVFSDKERAVFDHPEAMEFAGLERRDVIRLASLRRTNMVANTDAAATAYKAEYEALELALGVGLSWVKENVVEAPEAVNEAVQEQPSTESPKLPADHWFVTRTLVVPVEGEEGVTRTIDLMNPEGEDAMNPVVTAMRLVINHVNPESHTVYSVDNLVDGLMSLSALNKGIQDMTAALLAKTGMATQEGAAPLSSVFDPAKFYPLDPRHWLYTEKDNAPPMALLSPNDLPGRSVLAKAILAGVKWALSVATEGGTSDVFDPDRIAQQSVMAILGYATPTGLPSHGPYKDLERQPFDWNAIGGVRTAEAIKPVAKKKTATKPKGPQEVEVPVAVANWLKKYGYKAVSLATVDKAKIQHPDTPQYVRRALEKAEAVLIK